LLAARTQTESRWALFGSWIVIAGQFTLFLLIGVILFVYYRETNAVPPSPPDRIYPQFIWNNLPPGVAGLVIAAILAAAMSNLSAALNALASTTIMDFYKPVTSRLTGASRTEAHYLKLAQWATVIWGGILFVIGLVARNWGSVLEAGLSIASILYGALLGVFLLGLLTQRTNESGAMIGMVAGLVTMFYVKGFTAIAWTWYVLIGTATTMVFGYFSSLLFRRQSHE
jgi:solute:Na+ symporter, SSS family